MDRLFFVAATMNPIETEGTFPLPVAERDRFMMCLSMGYPDLASELGIVRDNPGVVSLGSVKPVCTRDEIVRLRDEVSKIHCAEELAAAAVRAARRTR
jgi:MoxR-like ATPase